MKASIYCSGLSYQSRPNAVIPDDRYQLPRLALARLNQAFLPDYSLLFLTDSLLVDRRTYDELVRGLIPLNGNVVLALKELHDVGLVELVDFEPIYDAVQEEVMEDLARDLAAFKSWEKAVADSIDNWFTYDAAVQGNLRPQIQQIRQAPKKAKLDYSDLASNYLHDLAGRIQMVKFFAEDALPRENPNVEVLPDAELLMNHLNEHLRSLRYSLALARQRQAGLHDWTDAAPYYQRALATAPAPALFELPLPELALWHPDKVVAALTSKAATDLRALVNATLFQGEAWNAKDATKCLSAIAKLDHGIPGIRRVTAHRQDHAAKNNRAKQTEKTFDWWFISDALGGRPVVG